MSHFMAADGMRSIRCVLFDLDGVIRHFDPRTPADAEERHGLTHGSLLKTGMAPELLDRLIVGEITRAEWVAEVGRQVGSVEAAVELAADIGKPDEVVLSVVDRLRAAGAVVAILTNGTDTVRAELDQLGITSRFDAIFNSAELGVAKPDPAIFRHVSTELGIDPVEIFFTDDSADKLAGGREIGMTVHHFTGHDPLGGLLAGLDRLGVPR